MGGRVMSLADPEPRLSIDEAERRMPTLALIDDDRIRETTRQLVREAPAYFWRVPASSSGYHHPACRGERGLWAHTLMLSTVIERLAPTYVQQVTKAFSEIDVDRAHAAAIVHDMRKNGDPGDPTEKSTSDHDIRMAEVVRTADWHTPGTELMISNAVASHMGAWYDGPEPTADHEQLVHTADMVASTATITVGVQGPIPEELADLGLEEVDLRG